MSITGIPGNIPYQGVKERNPPELHISRTRSPATSDSGPQFKIGDIWVDTAAGAFFVLLSKEQGVADWAVGGGAGSGVLTINTILPDGGGDFSILGGTNVTVTPGVNSITISSLDVGATSFPADTGTANEAAGVLNIFGGPGVDTTGAANTISINIAADVARFYAVDSGGPAVPTLNTLTVVGPSSSDFTGSGIETNVGATTNEIYLENRRFVSAFVVDANTTVGTRGEFSTIAAASAAASAGDTVYIRPGSYAGFTAKIGVSYVGLTAIGQDTNVTLTGGISIQSGPGIMSFSNIHVSSGGSSSISMDAAGLTAIFKDCSMICSATTIALTFGNLEMDRCDVETTGAASSMELDDAATGTFRNVSFTGFAGGANIALGGAGTLLFENCTLTGGDESFQAGAGAATFRNCQVEEGFNIDNCAVDFEHSSLDTSISGTSGFAMEAGSSLNCSFSTINSGAEQTVEMNAMVPVTMYHMIIDASTGGNWIDVVAGGSLDYANLNFTGSDFLIGGAGTITSTQWRPWGDTAGNVGVNSYLAADFAVSGTTGEVSLAAAGTGSFPSDNGTGTPLAGAMSFVDSTSSDFANSGLETHVGATANELYMENRRFPAAIVVDATTTVGDRGTHSTITAGLAAASAGDTVYVRPGTYAENFAVPIGVSLVGLAGPGQNEQVVVAGTVNATAGAGTTLIQNLHMSAASTKCFEFNGGAGSIFYVMDCTGTNATQVSRQVSGTVVLNRCEFIATVNGTNWDVEAGQVLATDTTFTSGAATCVDLAGVGTGSVFENCQMTNSGDTLFTMGPATQSYRADNCQIVRSDGGNTIVNTLGVAEFNYCTIDGNVEQQGDTITMTHCNITGAFQTDDATVTMRYCNWDQEINADDAAIFEIHHCSIAANLTSAFTIGGGAGGTCNMTHTHLDTATSPAVFITAADTFDYSHITFQQNSEMSGGGTFTQMPLPCSFHAFLGADVANATGDGTVFTLGTTTALTERFDSGSNFVPATGVFTAPTAGTYRFDVRFLVNLNSGTTFVMNVVTTGTTYEVGPRLDPSSTTDPSNEVGYQGTILAQMSSGDTATFTLTISNGALDVDVLGNAGGTESYVMGWLLE